MCRSIEEVNKVTQVFRRGMAKGDVKWTFRVKSMLWLGSKYWFLYLLKELFTGVNH